MKALVLAANGVKDCHLLYPCHALPEAGIALDVAGPAPGLVVGRHGYAVPIQRTFADLRPADYDLLILPSGGVPEAAWRDRRAAAAVRTLLERGAVLVATCRGGRLGLLPADGGFLTDFGPSAFDREPLRAAPADSCFRRAHCPDEMPAHAQAMFRVLKAFQGCSDRPDRQRACAPAFAGVRLEQESGLADLCERLVH